MNRIQLDVRKLFGFRIVTRPAPAASQTAQPVQLGAKIGVKVGLKD